MHARTIWLALLLPLSVALRTFSISVSTGRYANEVSWNVLCPGGSRCSGWAPYTGSCTGNAGSTCTLTMSDSFGDGWNGAQWVGSWSGGSTSGLTLPSGSSGSATFQLGSASTPAPAPSGPVTADCGANSGTQSVTLARGVVEAIANLPANLVNFQITSAPHEDPSPNPDEQHAPPTPHANLPDVAPANAVTANDDLDLRLMHGSTGLVGYPFGTGVNTPMTKSYNGMSLYHRFSLRVNPGSNPNPNSGPNSGRNEAKSNASLSRTRADRAPQRRRCVQPCHRDNQGDSKDDGATPDQCASAASPTTERLAHPCCGFPDSSPRCAQDGFFPTHAHPPCPPTLRRIV